MAVLKNRKLIADSTYVCLNCNKKIKHSIKFIIVRNLFNSKYFLHKYHK